MAANFWTSTHCRHWLFDKQTLAHKREINRGSFTQVESEVLNEFFVMVIQAVGKRLGWRQPVIATAVVFFKRFYVVSSLSEFDPRLVVPTALYLAAKVEEMGQIRVETVTEGLRSLLRSCPSFPNFPHFANQHIYANEFHLLESLRFDLVVFHPYRSLVQYAQDAGAETQCLQTAWDIINDSLRGDVSLLYPVHLIALAALYIASVFHRREIQPWMSKLNVDVDEVREVVRALSDLFRKHVTHDKASFRSTVLYKTFRSLDTLFQDDYNNKSKPLPNSQSPATPTLTPTAPLTGGSGPAFSSASASSSSRGGGQLRHGAKRTSSSTGSSTKQTHAGAGANVRTSGGSSSSSKTGSSTKRQRFA